MVNRIVLNGTSYFGAGAINVIPGEIARKLGVRNVDSMSTEEYRKAAVDAVVTLSKTIGIPQKMVDIGAKEEDLPRLAKMAYNDVCTPGNPRETTENEILEIFKKAFK